MVQVYDYSIRDKRVSMTFLLNLSSREKGASSAKADTGRVQFLSIYQEYRLEGQE